VITTAVDAAGVDVAATESATVNVAGLARQWSAWTRSGHFRAEVLRQQGDAFAASLHDARGEVRLAAMSLLRTVSDPMEAARIMHQRAARMVVRSDRGVPLAEYDDACRQYIRAHAWQACAQQIDPSLPEVQPLWPE
jgi:hypothetical protein